jgi:small-conductance mechanosensitive channel
MDMIDHVYFGNALGDWLLAATAFLVCFFVLPSIRLFVVARSRKLVGREAPSWINLVLLLITRTRRLFLVVVAFYVAERFLVLPQRIEDLSTALIVLTFWIQAALWGVAAVEFALKQRQDRMIAAGELKQSGSMSVLLFVARVAIFALAVLLALDNLGVNITALVAGLGIGGIAIALAVQTVLGDLLASLSITLDKPFRVGDLLRIDDIEGVVEFIGVRSTRLRSVTGEQVIIANADLLKNRLRNLGRMPERRMLFTLGIAYETSPDKLATVSDIVRRAVESVQGTRFEYCAMRGFGDSSLNFEVVYFVPDWDQARLRFIKINDEVNRAIHAAFAAEGVVFAYPTRSVIVRQ